MNTPRLAAFVLAALFGFCYSNAKSQLATTYTIDAGQAASASNYQNWNSAVSDLMHGTRTDGGPAQGPGISAGVIFDVAPGVYNESVVIGNIPGITNWNTITFRGTNKTTTILRDSGTTMYDATLQIDTADYIFFRNLTIENRGAVYGYGVMLTNFADQISFDDCILKVPNFATSNYSVPLITDLYYTFYNESANNLHLDSCLIIGGRFGLVLNGSSLNYGQGHQVTNTEIRDFYSHGVWSHYLNQFTIDHCTVTGADSSYDFGYGLYVRSQSELRISNSKIHSVGGYGIFAYNINIGSNTASSIYNNFIGGNFGGTAAGYCLYLYNSDSTSILHNSFLNDANAGYALFINGTSSKANDIRNNSIAFNGAASNGMAMFVGNQLYVQELDHNNYYSSGSHLAFWGTSQFVDLDSFKQAVPQHNQNSKEQWPNYIATTDLHSYGVALSNWADPNTSVTTDIDGESRPFTPDVDKDVGADEFLVPQIDVDLVGIPDPVVPDTGDNVVTLELLNNGMDTLECDTFPIQYSTDGGSNWNVNETFIPAPTWIPGTTRQFTFSTLWNISTPGDYTLCIRSQPNLALDPDTLDIICDTICTGLKGNYTIDWTQPTAGTNFNSFSDAAEKLSVCGISGSVVFNVAAGTYNEHFSLGDIPGADSTKKIEIRGVSCDSVIIVDSLTLPNSAIILLDGADYVTIRNIGIQSKGGFGYCIWLRNQSDYNIIDSCCMSMREDLVGSYNIGVLISNNNYFSYGLSGDYNTVSNCRIRGGYYGIRFNGPDVGAQSHHNSVIGNDIRNFYLYGLYSRHETNTSIIGNYFAGGPYSSFSNYGIYLYDCEGGVVIHSNDMQTLGRFGMYLYELNTSYSDSVLIYNNMIGAAWTGTSAVYGMYLQDVFVGRIYHNSVNITGNSGYAFYANSYSKWLDVRNNIFANQATSDGTTYAFYAAADSSFEYLDHNCYYPDTNLFVYYSGNFFTSLTNWQLTYQQRNQNSVYMYPGYHSNTDLNITCSDLDNLGTPVGVSADIDGDSRSLTSPDIGADEFTAQIVTLDLGPDTTVCGSIKLVLDTAKWMKFDWNSGGKNFFNVVNYSGSVDVLVADSNNCVATDTILITVDALPVEPWTSDSISHCQDDPLDALNPGQAYGWSTGATTQQIPSVPGNVNVIITSQAGCVTKDTVHVTLIANPSTSIGPDTTICLGVPYTVDAGISIPGQTYLWSTGDLTQMVNISTPGLFWVDVTAPNGCIATDTVLINAKLSPMVNLGPDGYACGPTVLDAGNPGASYMWNTGDTTQTLNAVSSGTFWVSVSVQSGCVVTDTISLTMSAAPTVNLGPDQIVCPGNSVTLDAGNSGSTFVWCDGSTGQTKVITTSDTCYVTVIDPVTGCEGTDTIVINASDLNVDLGPDSSICSSQPILLDAGNPGSTYSWSTLATTQTITVTQPGTYTVVVQDTMGCSDTDQVTFTLSQVVTAAFAAPATAPLFQKVQFVDQSSTAATSWFWEFGDGGTSTAQNPTHAFLGMGDWVVCLTASNGICADTICDTITITQPIAVDPEKIAAGISVYPNPTNGEFLVELDLPLGVEAEISVVDLHGRKLKNLVPSQGRKAKMDITDLPPAVYYLRLRFGNNESIKKKLVKL